MLKYSNLIKTVAKHPQLIFCNLDNIQMNLFKDQTFCSITIKCNSNIGTDFIFYKNQMLAKLNWNRGKEREKETEKRNGKEAQFPLYPKCTVWPS